MHDNKSFNQLRGHLKDIVNSIYNLGEPLSESRVVKKIFKSLPYKFISKVTAIEECEDLNTLSEDELVS